MTATQREVWNANRRMRTMLREAQGQLRRLLGVAHVAATHPSSERGTERLIAKIEDELAHQDRANPRRP